MTKPVISRPILSEPLLLHGREPTSRWQRFRKSPLVFLAKELYAWRAAFYPDTNIKDPIRVVCISDTHDKQPQLPEGDLLLHAGDLTGNGSYEALQAQIEWLNTQPHTHKVVIAGKSKYLCLNK